MAAFGFVEDVARYETAEAYIAVAAQRLKRPDDAKMALRRILGAEKVEKHYASLELPPALRSAVADTAKALLPPQMAPVLAVPPPPPPPPQSPARTDPAPVPDVAALLAEANRALNANELEKARAEYERIASIPDLPRATLLTAAEGLCRSRDFRAAAKAFERAGALGKGEEAYRYFYAVALYEVGRYRDAKRELAAALPFIKQTPDVKRYKSKIEHALD